MTPTAVLEEPGVEKISRRGEPIWELAMLYPPQGAWSESEYLSLQTNKLIEFTDGCLEFLPMPNLFHQYIVKFLFQMLTAHAKAQRLGDVLFAPLPVRLGPGIIREPDVIFLRPGRTPDLDGPAEGADLLMEVVSEGVEARQRDFESKRKEYADAKVADYWIVDPQERAITMLSLDGSNYRVHGQFTADTQGTSVLLPGFAISVAEVFDAGPMKTNSK